MRGKRALRLVMLLTISVAALAASPAIASAATCEPSIDSVAARPYWSSYDDYTGGLLTVDEYIRGSSSCGTCRYQVEEITASQGVVAHTSLPASVGSLSGGSDSRLTVKYQVPEGVNSFTSSLRVTCQTEPVIVTEEITIDPGHALANEGCPEGPVPDLAGLPLPSDQQYGARLFTVTLTDTLGRPLIGKSIKWSLSNNIDFRFLAQATITDASGQAAALVTPPQYFTGIAPWFDKGTATITALSEDGQRAEALFVYTRCAPVGEKPPWQ